MNVYCAFNAILIESTDRKQILMVQCDKKNKMEICTQCKGAMEEGFSKSLNQSE